MENKNSKSDIIKYVFTVLFFILTLGTFPSVASFIFLFTAIIIFPSVWEKITNFINGKMLVVICIILFFVGCATAPTQNIPTSNYNTETNSVNSTVTQNSVLNNTTNVVSDIPTFENEIEVNNTIENDNKVSSNTTANTNTNTNTNTNSSSTTKTSKSTVSSKKANSSNSDSKKSKNSSKKSSSSSSKDKESSSSGYVWVGETGFKYHKQTCPTLKGNGHKITLKEAKAQGREACKVCYK